MLINIGSSKEPSGIEDLLVSCHERIRSFISLARRIADENAASEREIQDAAARVVRYFSEALPLHVADEEQSILPRLEGKQTELDNALATMRREHEAHGPQLQELIRLCTILRMSPERREELKESLDRLAATLETEFLEHLEREERMIIPAIRTLLTDEEIAEISAEFHTRRRDESHGSLP